MVLVSIPKEYYPTPPKVIESMLRYLPATEYVLEPSAGEGALASALKERGKKVGMYEIHTPFHARLRAYGEIEGADFLTSEPSRRYKAIVMNPPFSGVVPHVSRAITCLQEAGGGVLITLLPKTSYPKVAEALQIEQKKARGAYRLSTEAKEEIGEAFRDALRRTQVECIILVLKVRVRKQKTEIRGEYEKLKKGREQGESKHLRSKGDVLDQYAKEMQALYIALDRVDEQLTYLEGVSSVLIEDHFRIEVMKIKERLQERKEQITATYWTSFFQVSGLAAQVPSKLATQLRDYFETKRRVAFSKENAAQILEEVRQLLPQSYIQGAVDVFDRLTSLSAGKYSKNIQYITGWKTNDPWKVRSKIIIPKRGYTTSNGANMWLDSMPRGAPVVLEDLGKVFGMLEGGKPDTLLFDREYINKGKRDLEEIETKYFKILFYKKGTCHVKIKDKELLGRFNYLAAHQKGWIGEETKRKPSVLQFYAEELEEVKKGGLKLICT